MGWASGSGLGEEVWAVVRKYVPKGQRKAVAARIYNLFCNQDADDWSCGAQSLQADAGECQCDPPCGAVRRKERAK